ncbi:MAG TPA: hypothetical protein VG370_12130 [Chloroflexota bacterium]|nr:hypothetical protein [Chloroflexota bacterium]
MTDAAQQHLALDVLNHPHIEFLILADRAEAINGKLYLMGGAWDRTFVQDFGQPVPLSFALSVQVPWVATNQPHTIEITIEDLDRRQSVDFEMRAEFVAGRPAWARVGQPQRVILTIPGAAVMLKEPGEYQIVAKINGGETESRVAFHAVPAHTQPPPQAGR